MYQLQKSLVRLKFRTLAIITVMAMFVTALIPSPSHAVDTHPPTPAETASVQLAGEAVSALKGHASSLVKTPAAGESSARWASTLTSENAGKLEIPRNPEEAIRFTDLDETTLEITPVASSSHEGAVTAEGVITYPTSAPSIRSAIPTHSGLQQLTTLIDSSAPERYAYEIHLPSGASLEPSDDGGVQALRSDGSLLTAAAAPWARDANGLNIPTRFEIDGNKLVQIVDHRDAKNISYPVVADPFWLAPAVVRCLIGIGINGPTITRIMQTGTPQAIIAAGGYAAVRCLMGR